MIRFLYGTQLADHASLADAMFRDRAAQFRDRLGWDVQVDALGWETDAYDRLDPLYVIAVDGQGGHAGSMRLMPTTGPHMLADHFADLVAGPAPRGPALWEVTRFCLAPDAAAGTAPLLALGLSTAALALEVDRIIGLFEAPMLRVYRRLGWRPQVIGRGAVGMVGTWDVSARVQDRLTAACGLDAAVPLAWAARDLELQRAIG